MLSSGCLAAHADHDAGLDAGFCRQFDRCHNGGMRYIIELRHCGIQPVRCHDILRQIIGTDGEKCHFLGKRRRDHHGCWCLDHNTEIEVRVLPPLGREFCRTFLDQRARSADFAKIGDHRQHDLDIAMHGGTQERA